MDRVHSIVIGAGVVGLAIARALARDGREVLVLDAAESFGTETSARNSEVVHAGIYYPAGSLKARLCVAGRRMLYEYCAAHGVPVRHSGKFIVGTQPGHEAKLAGILERARANGVEDIDWIDADAARRAEPGLRCVAALDSRSTGIVDSHAFMLALLGDLENAGGALATHAPVLRVAGDASGWIVHTGGTEAYTIGCDVLVNAAGVTRFVPHDDLDGLDDELIDTILRTNVRGAFAAVRVLRPLLERSELPGGGVVVNVSSIAAVTGQGSNVAYCASKAALDSLTRSLGRALAPRIRVVSVSPGVVDTGFIRSLDPAWREDQLARTPLGRLASPGEVAAAVLAAVRDLTFTTGSVLAVDGGRPLA